ncbi:DgaE family pyridoxal phosphate-dependent ammonia lyase [Atopococcus tabaci]|uniref:DgaE family pyridoxal phosphate-dependent ammonia lyase n=1 Tax=Atopococcus tabaci TaxID=269774 RepID=UPI0004096B58|nr:DgaE family pyridoxal phosphate-dependent ammonia lyase [Atopococcus tabaci]
MKSIYEKYDLTEVINASGKMTALGVSKYPDEAIEAQQFGGKNFFVMDQLAENVGAYVAKLIGAEDAHIVSSASAGIAQSVAAVIGKGSMYHLHHPFSKKITQREIIVPKGHNVDYGAPVETMVELGGGVVVEAGYANKCTPALIEEMITDETAAILYIKSHHTVQKSMLSVEEAVDVAHRHNLPLIIDAAAEQDLHKYLESGADLVIYSGAKALEGTTSGLVIGAGNLVKWVRMQSYGIGRAMKIGKENILGLAAAIELYLEKGAEPGEEMKARLSPFIEELSKIPGINVSVAQDPAGREIYRAKVVVRDDAPLNALELIEELKKGELAIYTREHQANNGIIEFDIRSVNEEEMDKIIIRMKEILTKK